jgi:predicted membrane channel-forming protein YqfA (hemolysin III family)
MNQPSIVDVVGLFVLIAATVFSNEAAAIVGPYLVIVVAAAIGASFKLSRKEKMTRTDAVFFFLRVVILAVLLTAGAAKIANSYRPDIPIRVLIAPIALMIGYVDWPHLLSKIVGMVYGGVDLLRGGTK